MDDDLVNLVYAWRAAFEQKGEHDYYSGHYSIQSSWAHNDFGYASLKINRTPNAALVDEKGYEARPCLLSVSRAATHALLHPYKGREKDLLSLHLEEGLLSSCRLLSIRGNQQSDYDIRDFSRELQPRAQRLVVAATELLERYTK